MRHTSRIVLCAWLLVGPAHATLLFQDGFEDGDLTANPMWLISGSGGTAGLEAGGRLNSQWRLSLGCDGGGNNADVVSTALPATAFTASFWIRQRPHAFPIAEFGLSEGAFTPAGRLLQVTVNRHNNNGLWYWNYIDYAGGGSSQNQMQITYEPDHWVQVEVRRSLSGAWTLTYDKDGPWQAVHSFQGATAWSADPWLWIRGGCYYNQGGTYVDDVLAIDDAPTPLEVPWCDGFEMGSLEPWLQQGGPGTVGLASEGHGSSTSALELSCDAGGNNQGRVSRPMDSGSAFRTRVWIRQRPAAYPILHLGICDGPYAQGDQLFRVTINRHDGDGQWYLNARDYRDGFETANQQQIVYDDTRWYQVELSRSATGLWSWVFDKGGPGEAAGSHQETVGFVGEPWLFLEAGCYYNPGGSLVDDVCVEPYDMPLLTESFWIHRRTDTFSGMITGLSPGEYTGTNREDRVYFGMHNGDMAWHLRLYHGDQALVDDVMEWPGDRWLQVRIEHYASGLWRTIWDVDGPAEHVAEATRPGPVAADPHVWFTPIGYYANTGGFYLDKVVVRAWDGAQFKVLEDDWEDGDWTQCPPWSPYAGAVTHFNVVPMGHESSFCLEGFAGLDVLDQTALFTAVERGPDPFIPVNDLTISTLSDLSMQLNWSPVTETVCGETVQPDGYIIYYTEQLGPGAVYYFLDYAYATEYVHHGAAEFSTHTFYRAAPHRGVNPAILGVTKGMTRAQALSIMAAAIK